jgi:hypothetical protein
MLTLGQAFQPGIPSMLDHVVLNAETHEAEIQVLCRQAIDTNAVPMSLCIFRLPDDLAHLGNGSLAPRRSVRTVWQLADDSKGFTSL